MLVLKEKKWKRLISCIILFSLPLMAGGLFCIIHGVAFNDIFLPSMMWNDEMFYYTQIDGAIKYGIPQGYFGYNESTAQIGTFGAWSPVSFVAYIILGNLFGWGVYKFVIYNMIIVMFSMLVFALLVDLDKSEVISIILLYLSYAIVTRHNLSGMIESEFVGLGIVVVGLFYYIIRKQCEERKIIVLSWISSALIFLFSLARPYILLLLFFPSYCIMTYIKSKSKKKTFFVIEGIVLLLIVFIYFKVITLFVAPYFTPQIDLTRLINPKDGIKYFAKSILTTLELMIKGITEGSIEGSWYIAFFAESIWIFVKAISKNGNKRLFYRGLLLINIMMYVAIAFLYAVGSGSRHVMLLSVIEILIIALEEKSGWTKGIIIAIFILVFYIITDDNMKLSDVKDEDKVYYYELKESLASVLELSDESRWDNTILWTGETDWQKFYAFPAGFGISCVYSGMVYEDFENIKSKYIFTFADCDMNAFLSDKGLIPLFQDEKVTLWMIR